MHLSVVCQQTLRAGLYIPHVSKILTCKTTSLRLSTFFVRRRLQLGDSLICRGLKAVEGFDSDFTLDTASQEVLFQLLHSDTFRRQVVEQCNLPLDSAVEFTELLFQPVPWSPSTKKGMPAEFEQYLDDPQYTVVNVPPNYMFQAKVFKPSRLCAVYKCCG